MKKWLYLLLTIVFAILEFSMFPLWDIKPPALALLLTVLAGLRVSPKFGLITGIIGGLVSDFAFGFAIPQMAITLGSIGLLTGLISIQLFDVGLVTYVLASIIATFTSIIMATFFSVAFNFKGWQLVFSLENIGKTILINLVFSVIVYFLLRRHMPED